MSMCSLPGLPLYASPSAGINLWQVLQWAACLALPGVRVVACGVQGGYLCNATSYSVEFCSFLCSGVAAFSAHLHQGSAALWSSAPLRDFQLEKHIPVHYTPLFLFYLSEVEQLFRVLKPFVSWHPMIPLYASFFSDTCFARWLPSATRNEHL